MVGCDGPCQDWYHIDCVGLSMDQAAAMKEYICSNCGQDTENIQPSTTGLNSETITPPATPGKSIDTSCTEMDATSLHSGPSYDSDSEMEIEVVTEPKIPDGYFSVESILDHKIDRNGRRTFQVKWDGYQEITWEIESNLDGCVGLLEEYLAKEGLEATRIIARAGASAGLPSNPLNWISAEQVVKTVKSFSNTCAYNTCLDLTILEGPITTTEDGLYLINHYSHFYVLLYLAEQSTSYIADGDNTFSRDSIVRQELADLTGLGTSFSVISYNQQSKADYCGSSAVMIALELKRVYKNHLNTSEPIPSSIRVPVVLKGRIIRRLHKYQSATIPNFSNCISNYKPLECRICGKLFKGKNAGRALNSHKLHCNKQ